jgi:2-polyprenyl-3-methyl-5-hydroxy-6-metoxy-1,4-benzoquinol methylase
VDVRALLVRVVWRQPARVFFRRMGLGAGIGSMAEAVSDWNEGLEAAFLLKTSRELKANHAAFTIAIAEAESADAAASLSDRFGPDIWETLKGKRVLDYGCGHGADVLECARHGVDATGFEVRPILVEGARRQAQKAGLSSSFYHTNEYADQQGTFDIILSVDCFEHYLDPAGVLEHMHQVLKPTSVVLVSFSPPWLHPYGGHSREITPLPWVHLIFPESAVIRVRAEYLQEEATCYEEAAGGLNRMTVAKFKRVVAGSPFVFRKLELLPVRNIKVLTKIPALRELFTAVICAELVPRDSATTSS